MRLIAVLSCLAVAVLPAQAPPAPVTPPPTAIKQVLLRVERIAGPGGPAIDTAPFEGEARAFLKAAGVTLADAPGPDPAATHVVALRLKTASLDDGYASCLVLAKGTLLSDLQIAGTGTVDPRKVRQAQRMAALKGKGDFQATSIRLLKAALKEILFPPATPDRERTVWPRTTQPRPPAEGDPQAVDVPFSELRIQLKPPPPAFPNLARIQRVQGVVAVEITIDPQGNLVLAETVGGPAELQEAAVRYALQWQFLPTLVNGVPVRARSELTMPFRLRGPEAP